MNPWQHNDRVRRTPQQRAALFLKRGGRCEHPDCLRKLMSGDGYYIEHVIALENGGTDDDDNLQIWCEWHKPAKDAADHKQAGKQRRTATKHLVPGKHTKTRPMDGSKSSPFRKRMNGTVERR